MTIATPAAIQEALHRTTLGAQPFADIVQGLRWAKWKPPHPQCGTSLDKAPGESYVGVCRNDELPVSGIRLSPNGIHAGRALVGQLRNTDPEEAAHRSCQVIPWLRTGWCLVTLATPGCIDAEWLAFVPISEVISAVQVAAE